MRLAFPDTDADQTDVWYVGYVKLSSSTFLAGAACEFYHGASESREVKYPPNYSVLIIPPTA
jgi:hypothetical protein